MEINKEEWENIKSWLENYCEELYRYGFDETIKEIEDIKRFIKELEKRID